MLNEFGTHIIPWIPNVLYQIIKIRVNSVLQARINPLTNNVLQPPNNSVPTLCIAMRKYLRMHECIIKRNYTLVKNVLV